MKAKRPVWQVFQKEMKEMVRDKRVRNAALVMPIVVVVLMISLFGTINASVGAKSKQKVWVVQTSNPLLKTLQSGQKLDVKIVQTEAEGKKLIQDGKARLLIEFGQTSATGQSPIQMFFDSKEDLSEVAKASVRQTLEPYQQQVEQAVLATKGLTKEQLEPLSFKETPITVGEGKGAGGMIIGILPYLLVLFTFTGGFSIAGDLVAGEKEKSTLETLLITPVPRTEIVLGKFLSLSVVCFLSGMSAVVGLAAAATLKMPGSEMMFAGGLGFTPKSILVLFLLLLPLVAFFAGLLLAVSTFARNTREAQTYLGIVNIFVIIPAVFSQVLGFTDYGSQAWINFIPVLNTAANIRADFQGKVSLTGVTETVGEGLLLAAAMLVLAVWLFNREKVLVRI